MSEKRHVIEVAHVNKNFRDNKVLKDISLRCESGKIYGLVGHNGSGKTVLFKIICGFLSCDEGMVSIDGKIMGSAVFLLGINLIVFGINQYNHQRNIEVTDMQLLLQKEADSAEYYKMLLSQTENRNILIHDIKKHLQTIKLLNDKVENDKINAYICQLLDSSDLKEPVRICDNEMLNAILGRYQRQCVNKHIDFHADIRSGVLKQVSPHDLTSLFCNLMDNAVEAAENIPEAFIEVTAQKKENSPFCVIVVINSCRVAPTYGADNLPVSNKKNVRKHGYGIKSIKKVTCQYGGNLQMYYDEISATFHAIITLKV